jgi:hypothetical protein
VILGLQDTCTIKSRIAVKKLNFVAGVVNTSAVIGYAIIGDMVIGNTYVAPGYTGTPVVGQTVTGTTSHATAVITRVETGYITIGTVVGTFVPAETISTTTFSATLTSITAYKNALGEPEYSWDTVYSNVPCRIYTRGTNPNAVREPGEMKTRIVKIALPPTITVSKNDKIVSTNTAFSATYGIIDGVYAFKNPGGIDHYEAVLREEASP